MAGPCQSGKPPSNGVADTCGTSANTQEKRRSPLGGEEEEEEANFAPGHRLSLNVTVERVSVGGEIEAEGEEEFDFGPGNPYLEDRASDRRAEIGVEDLDQSGIDGGEGSEEDEARVPKMRRAPRGPTQIERERHEALRLPYRDWCAHCVRGSGEKTPRADLQIHTRGGAC